MVINRQMALSKTKTAITLALTLAALPMVGALTGCSDSKVSLQADNKLVSTKVTEGDKEPIWPNDDPSIPDGKGIYAAQNCATCHGADGKPVGTTKKIGRASCRERVFRAV